MAKTSASIKVTPSMVNDQVVNIMKEKGLAAKALTAVFTSGVAAGESKAKAIAAIRAACAGKENAKTGEMTAIPLATFRQVRLMFMAADIARRLGYGAGENAMAKAIGKLCALNAKSVNKDKKPQRNAAEDLAETNARSEWREMVRKAQLVSPEMRGGQNKTAKGSKATGSRKGATVEPSKPATPSNVVEFPAAKVKTVDAIARVVLNVAAHLDAMEKQSASAMTGDVGAIVRKWIVETRAVVAAINEASAKDDKAAQAKAVAKAAAKIEKAKAAELDRVVMKQG